MHCFCVSKDKVFEKEGFVSEGGDSEGERVSDTLDISEDVGHTEVDSLCGVVTGRSENENEC